MAQSLPKNVDDPAVVSHPHPVAKAIVDGEVKMTLSDLDKLIRLESFLRDEPDSRQEIIIADLRNKSNEELREMIREETRLLKGITG